jgi:hypothetical protein
MDDEPKEKSRNSKEKLQERLKAGHITWIWPVMILFSRLVFAVLSQALVAGLFRLQGDSTPWQSAAPWWPVYGTLIDIGSLLLLSWLTRKEGIGLYDLMSFHRQHLQQDLVFAMGLAILIPSILIIGGEIVGSLLYGGATPAPMPFGPLPPWGAFYALFVWPVFWAIAEEMT